MIAGPSTGAILTTKDGQRFPEMPALPPLVSSLQTFPFVCVCVCVGGWMCKGVGNDDAFYWKEKRIERGVMMVQ